MTVNTNGLTIYASPELSIEDIIHEFETRDDLWLKVIEFKHRSRNITTREAWVRRQCEHNLVRVRGRDPDKIKAAKHRVRQCECGCKVVSQCLSKHKKSIKHINRMKEVSNPVEQSN